MPESILSRMSQNHFSTHPVTTPLQTQMDGLVSGFSQEAANPRTLASIAAGSMAYRLTRLGVMGLGVQSTGYFGTLARPLSIVLGLGSEVVAFEGTGRTLGTLSGDHSNPNAWRWAGPGGLGQGLVSSLITFGMLKSAGHLSRSNNIIFQHAFSSAAMVAGHNTAAHFGAMPTPEGSFVEQIMGAEAINIQLGAGVALVHSMSTGVNAYDRGLDLSFQSRDVRATHASPLPQLTMAPAGEGGRGGTPENIQEIIRKPIRMCMTGGDHDGPRDSSQSSDPPSRASTPGLESAPPRESLSVPQVEGNRPVDEKVLKIATAIRNAGGKALIVGGYVRDRMLGQESKDLDVEVYGLELTQLENVLGGFGEIIQVGRSFGVLRVKGLEADFSIPRRDAKISLGHRGFRVELDPNLSFEEASRRRDLTINSMGWDPLTNEIFDPHGGREDIRRKILRATDRTTFHEDPLRGLRVAQLAARFNMNPEPLLLELCRTLDLSELPGERLLEEFRKMLLKSPSPSRGLEILRQSELLKFFPELEAMVGVPQDPEWHPEGTVWEHTLMVLDEAAKAKTGDDDQDLIVLFAALSHDLGKPETTFEENGRIRSPQHSERGEAPTESFLRRFQAPPDFINQVKALVRFHLAPTLMVVEGATGKGFRRLARKLEEAGTNSHQLFLVGRADHFGRTTAEALARYYPYGEIFLKTVSDLGVDHAAEKDVVLGRHLIARGLSPSPQFTTILEKCREIQYETGWDDPLRIIDAVLPPHLAFSLPDTRRRVIKSNMVNLPAQPTENDINAVGLLLPAGFKLSLNHGKVVMTVLGGGDFSIPLFTYEISPGMKGDYQGPLLSQVLEALAQKVKSILENTPFDSPATFNDIMNVILPPAQDVTAEHCPKKEFSIRVGEILTTEPTDWKSP